MLKSLNAIGATVSSIANLGQVSVRFMETEVVHQEKKQSIRHKIDLHTVQQEAQKRFPDLKLLPEGKAEAATAVPVSA